MKKRYITLCNSEKYIKGTLVLYESLNATNTTVPLVVFCTKKTPARVISILREYADKCTDYPCRLEILESNKDVTLPDELTRNNKWVRWNGTFDKLLVFGLEEYDKLVFIDSDMLVLKNLDHLFDCPHLSACCDGQYCKGDLNSGLMVIEPTKDEMEMSRILSCISAVVHNPQFGDQDIIRLAYPQWKTCQELHLPEQYNLFFENAARKKKESGYDIADNADMPIYIIHFIGYDKPWYTGRHLKWKIYNLTWKSKMCLQGRTEHMNSIVAFILRKYHCYLRAVNRKLKKAKVKIYEMG